MNRKVFLIILAAVILTVTLSGCDIIRSTFNVNAQTQVPASPSPSQIDEATWVSQMRSKQIPTLSGVDNSNIIDWDTSYLVYAAYPQVKGKDTLNLDMKNYVQRKVDLFKDEASQNPGQAEDGKPQITITYKPFAWKEAVVSFEFITNADSGLSKTNNFITTFVYNMRTQNKMSLDDVFNGNMNYLNTISSLVKNKLAENTALQKNMDQPLFDAGTAPEKQNFSNFVVGNSQVTFFFNQRQIAPASAGSFEVSLSFDELKNVLWPDILNPTAAQPDADADAGTAVALPDFLESGPGDMKAFSIDGIDPKKDKVIALTFDDGPNPSTTDEILDALAKYNAHATFFVLGNRVEQYPSTVRRIYESGNEIGNHSYDHKDFKTISTEKMMDEIDKTNQAIYETVGVRPILVRPPYGNVTDKLAKEIGRASILWTVDPEDWKYKDKDIDYNNVMDTVRDGDIVLMHDIYQPSADAARRIVRELTDRGYKLVTVSQMIQIAQARGQDVNLIVRDLRMQSKK